MSTTSPKNFSDIPLPAFVQFHWQRKRTCSFEPVDDCVEAVLREIASIEKCAYLRAYHDLDASPEVRALAVCYYVELFKDGDDCEPYFFGKLYIPCTIENEAIDENAKFTKGLAGMPTVFQGSAYLVSAAGEIACQ